MMMAATMTLDEDNDTKSNILAATMTFGEENEHNKSDILKMMVTQNQIHWIDLLLLMNVFCIYIYYTFYQQNTLQLMLGRIMKKSIQ